MQNRLQAQIWELWHSSRWELLQIMGIQLVFLLLIGGLNFLPGGDDETTQGLIRGLFVIMCMAVSVFSQSWRNSFESRHIGFSFHLGFARPISTAQLVIVPMLYIIVAACLWFLIPASIYALVINVDVPIIGPMLFVSCVVSCFVAVAWSTQTVVSRAVGLVSFFVALIGFIFLFHRTQDAVDPMLIAVGKLEYYDLSVIQLIGFLISHVVAIALTIVAVDRQRHGDIWQPTWKRSKTVSVVDQNWLATAFRSALTAQIWYEMRRFGIRTLAIGLLAPFAVLALAMIGSQVYPNSTWIYFWIVCVFAGPLAYQLLGIDGAVRLRYAQGALQVSLFDSTCPMRNDQLIGIKLTLIGAISVVGCIGMATAAFMHAWINGDAPIWAELFEKLSVVVRDVSLLHWIGFSFAAAMIFFSSTSMMMAGALWLPVHPKLFAAISTTLYGIGVLAMLDSHHGWNYSIVWVGMGWVTTIGVTTGCLWAIRKALVSGFISQTYFLVALGLWAIYLITMIGIYMNWIGEIELPLVAKALGLTGLLVPLATTALAPLALAEHRHG